MPWQNDGGQQWAQQGVTEGGRSYPQNGGQLSRSDAMKLYELNLAAVRENLRRRDRANWFFLALAFVALPLMTLVLVQLNIPFMATLLSFVAAFLGVPMCLAWRGVLRYSQDEHEKLVHSIREMEHAYGIGYSPLGEEEHNPMIRPRARLFSLLDELVPMAAMFVFLALVFFVWRDEILVVVQWCINSFFAVLNWLWPTTS